jgi:hypothetical protein
MCEFAIPIEKYFTINIGDCPCFYTDTIILVAGQQFCITDSFILDPNIEDTTVLWWTNNIHGLTYTRTSYFPTVAELCWTPTLVDVDSTPYSFNYSIEYHSCPVGLFLGNTRYFLVTELNNTEELIEDKITLFPNPFSDFTTFRFGGNLKKMNFTLFDIQGRQILNTTVTNNFILEKNDLKEGIYFYILSASDKNYFGKMIIN